MVSRPFCCFKMRRQAAAPGLEIHKANQTVALSFAPYRDPQGERAGKGSKAPGRKVRLSARYFFTCLPLHDLPRKAVHGFRGLGLGAAQYMFINALAGPRVPSSGAAPLPAAALSFADAVLAVGAAFCHVQRSLRVLVSTAYRARPCRPKHTAPRKAQRDFVPGWGN